MVTFIVRWREGGNIAVEAKQITSKYPDGTGAPVITAFGEGNEIVAIIPGDAVSAVYRKDAETKAEGGPVGM